ncbi:MAG: pyridoxine 5'-phosphate synthase, partial [Flavobacteriales bacterium]
GWDTLKNKTFLREIVQVFKSKGIRVSLFVDPVEEMIKGAAETGADRVELYTESYASLFPTDPVNAVAPFARADGWAHSYGLGLNAGHDLDLKNLRYLKNQLPHLLEVSIGHALISDALYFGLENTVQLYLRELK